MADTRITAISTTYDRNTIDPDGDYVMVDRSGGSSGRILVEEAVFAALANTSDDVGIGAASPGTYAPLYIYRNSNAGRAVIVDNDSTGAASAAGYALNAGTVSAEIMVLSNGYNSSGVYGTSASSLQIINRATSSIVFKTSGYTDAYERMRITSSGNVGIGTTSPGTKLHVAYDSGSLPSIAAGNALIVSNNSAAGDAAYISVIAGTTGIAGLMFGDSADENAGQIWYDNNVDYLYLRTSGAGTSATISSSGNVGIGTTSPSQLLHVKGANQSFLALYNETGMRGAFYTAGSGDGQLRVYDTSDNLDVLLNAGGASYLNGGNVGIGTTSPTAKLQVNGALAIVDGMTAPSTISGYAVIYVDSADGDLKVKFGNGFVATIASDS